MKIKISVFLLAAVLVFCSCTAGDDPALPPDAIPVLSNYPNLTYIVPGDFDADLSQDPQWAKHGYSTYVTKVDGRLAVMPAHYDGSSVAPGVEASSSYFVGELWGGAKGVFVAEEVVLPEACTGIIASADGMRALAFTTVDGKSKMYAFERKNGGWYLQDDSTVFNGRLHMLCFDWPSANYDPPPQIYLLTNQSVVIVHSQEYLLGGEFSTIRTVEIETPDWWELVVPTSAVQIDQELFVGDRQGVIKLNAEDGTIKYYPIDDYRSYQGG